MLLECALCFSLYFSAAAADCVCSAACTPRISPGTASALFKKENGAINKLLKRQGLSPPHDFSPVNSETLFAVFAVR